MFQPSGGDKDGEEEQRRSRSREGRKERIRGRRTEEKKEERGEKELLLTGGKIFDFSCGEIKAAGGERR